MALPAPQHEPAETVPEAARVALADELLAVIASIRRTGRRDSERPPELYSLSSAQVELVRLVRRRPGVSVTDAAAQLRLAANTVSTLVGSLTQAGLLLRTVDERDRRVARLALSPEMQEKMEAWRDRRLLALAGAIGDLEPGDERLLTSAMPVLGRLAEHLEQEGRRP